VPNPAEQVGGPHLGELFEGLQTRFDVIVVDTPPVNSVSDSITTLKYVNLVLLVIKAGKTSERAVKRTISEIQRSGSRVDGMVLNQLPKHGGYGYYYYYYSKDGYKSSGVYGAPAKGA
jgi:Mrp family chromosome partitioning ATPase